MGTVCHSGPPVRVGISLGQRGQRDPLQGDRAACLVIPVPPVRVGISLDSAAEQRDSYGVTEFAPCHAVPWGLPISLRLCVSRCLPKSCNQFVTERVLHL
jgi:hypothetical protein